MEPGRESERRSARWAGALLLDFIIVSLFELASASGLILSFLIVPTWIFAVLLNHLCTELTSGSPH